MADRSLAKQAVSKGEHRVCGRHHLSLGKAHTLAEQSACTQQSKHSKLQSLSQAAVNGLSPRRDTYELCILTGLMGTSIVALSLEVR